MGGGIGHRGCSGGTVKSQGGFGVWGSGVWTGLCEHEGSGDSVQSAIRDTREMAPKAHGVD